MTRSICRWGILGAAGIARKNWQAIRKASNCTLTAVASRDLEKCRQFVADCQGHVSFDPPPRALGSYEELIDCDDVDAIYIPLPTAVRTPWAIRAAEAGKHVLVEKPVGASLADTRAIVEACQRNRVQFMDGVMFMHSRRLDSIRKYLDDRQTLGQIKRISTQFTFGASEDFFAGDIRVNSQLEPLGCLGDLGWYNLRFTLWVMNWELPQQACGHVLAERGRPDSPSPVPTDFSAELFFGNGTSASFYCSFLAEIQQWANISGTKGFIHVPDFVLPFYASGLTFEVSNPKFNLEGCDFNMENRTQRIVVPEYSHRTANAQETNMFRRFAEMALSGKPDPFWGDIAIKTQQVSDACLESARKGGQLVDVG